jgi:DnaJ homologue, subfamily C, member 28, conserved domain
MSSIKAVEEIIAEAMVRGEFDNLPGAGKPLDLSAYFNTPEELRLAYSILKNANLLPGEAELLKEIAARKEELDTCPGELRRKELRREIDNRLLNYHTLIERRKDR